MNPSPRLVAVAVAAASALSLIGGATAAVAVADEGAGWTVQTVDGAHGAGRGSFSYELDPGQSISDAMRVVNTGTTPLPLDVYAADAFTTPTGDIDLVTDGSTSTDAGRWVTVEAPQVILQPGQQVDVPFTVSVPSDAVPGDHAAGLVTSLVTQEEGQTLTVDRRLGTRMNFRVSGALAPGAAIDQVRTAYTPSWNPFEAGTVAVEYAVRNTGNTRLTGVVTVDVSGPAGLLTTASAPEQLPEIIPGSTVVVRRVLPVVSLGWLGGTVVVAPEAVGPGTGALAAVTADYSAVAVPWSLLVLLLVVTGGVVTVVLLIRRRSRPGPSDQAAPSPSRA